MTDIQPTIEKLRIEIDKLTTGTSDTSTLDMIELLNEAVSEIDKLQSLIGAMKE